MSEWIEKPLGKLARFQKGRKVQTADYPQDGYDAYLGASSLEEGNVEGYALTSHAVMVDTDDVLMLWDGERSGLVGHNLRGVVSSTVQRLTSGKEITGTYLYYHLLFRFDWIQGRRTGTGVPHVPKDLARILYVKYPLDTIEQESITSILASIDKAIEKTESLITKYQQVKAGLMHDLFTRGVTADGKLRPPREQAQELYRETPIGWIPKEWQIVRMIDLAEERKGSTTIGPFGSDLVATDYRLEGVPVVFVRDVKVTGFEWNSDTYVSEKKALQLSAHSVKSGDVLVSKMGLPPCISCLYPEWMPNGVITADMIRLSPDAKKVDGYWLATTINYDRVKRQVAAITAGVTRSKVTLADFRGIKIAKPELLEQQQISVRLRIAQSRIDTELVKISKLLQQKSGLMHDLLTGKVRVAV